MPPHRHLWILSMYMRARYSHLELFGKLNDKSTVLWRNYSNYQWQVFKIMQIASSYRVLVAKTTCQVLQVSHKVIHFNSSILSYVCTHLIFSWWSGVYISSLHGDILLSYGVQLQITCFKVNVVTTAPNMSWYCIALSCGPGSTWQG